MMKKHAAPSQYRVWWIPQVPGSPFYADVPSVEEGLRLLKTLAAYDAFQFEHNIKPDYCNSGGMEVFVDGEWEEYDEQDDCDSMELQ